MTHRRMTLAAFTASIFVFALLFQPCLAVAQSTGRTNIAILDLELSGDIKEGYSRTLSDKLRQELFMVGRYNVIERSRMEDVLNEQGFQLSCVSTECAVQAGQLLGVEEIIAGSLGLVGNTYSLIIRRIDVGSGQIIDLKNVDCQCSIDEVLSVSMKQVAYMISGLAAPSSEYQPAFPTTPVTRAKGDLFVKSDPDGAEIFIDGEKRQGITPLFLEGLSAGPHQIRLEKGNLVGAASVFVAADQTTRTTIKLEQGMASLRVISDPFDATVILDGETVGVTPLTLNSVSAGQHTVRLELNDYSPHEETLSLGAGESKRVEVSLKKAGGLIIVTSNLARAEVTVNGKSKTVDFPFRSSTLLGSHEITVNAKDHDPFHTTVEVNEEKEYPVHAELVRQTGALKLSSLPLNTEVYLDGELIGTAPLGDRTLPTGSYHIKLRRPGYDDGKSNVFITDGQALEPASDLERKTFRKALTRSLILPGNGQMYLNRTVRGAVMMVGEIASVTMLASSISDYNREVKFYWDAREDYDNAILPEEIASRYEDRMNAYNNVEATRSMVVASSVLVAGFYIWSVIDILLNPTDRGVSITSMDDANNSSVALQFGLVALPSREAGGRLVPGVGFSISFGCGGGGQ
ncbi:MAG: PEGA domain-containing protein [bacterium]